MKNLLTAKILAVLNCAADADAPLSLKEIRQRTGLPVAIVSRICADLVEGGFLERDGYHAVAPAAGLLRLASGALRNSPTLRRTIPLLRRRAAALGVRTALLALANGRITCFYRSPSGGGIETASREPWWRFEAAALLLPRPETPESADDFTRRIADAAGSPAPDPLLPSLRRIADERKVLRSDLRHGWCVQLPLPDRPGFAASLFGVELPAGTAALPRMLDECRILADRLDAALSEKTK